MPSQPDAIKLLGLRNPDDLWRYVDRFSANFPARPANLFERPQCQKDIVLITGTTGGFGCDVLEHLLRDKTVQLVYAFNRKGSLALERQRKQFSARGLETALLDTPKFRMVQAVLHEPGFGIDAEVLEEVRISVTHIIMNAWRVNFNLPITSFEGDMQGVRNFVNLALSSPFTNAPAIILVSSIVVLNKWEMGVPVPEIPIDNPAPSFGMGYSESKWVSERVLQNVTRERGAATVVVRLGQVAGDRTGYWNEREWFASLVKSALFQKCLPELDGTKVAWIPSYEAARAFAEMRHSPEPILHLVHPRSILWRAAIAPIAQELDVPLIPYAQWLAALKGGGTRESAKEAREMSLNPALRLLPFFNAPSKMIEGSPEREAMGFMLVRTDKATRVSGSLASLPQIDGERATLWLAAWRKSGFMPPQRSKSWKGKL